MMRRSHLALLSIVAGAACGTRDVDPAKRDDAVTVLRFEPQSYVEQTRPIRIEFSKPDRKSVV